MITRGRHNFTETRLKEWPSHGRIIIIITTV